jgi:hypothetical protein
LDFVASCCRGLIVPQALLARADEVIEEVYLLRCIWQLLAQSGHP